MNLDPRTVYLDYAAATPLDERVFRSMEPYLREQFYNPSSSYTAARNIKNALAEAKDSIGRSIGAKSSEIIMTAGATESINLAVWGVASGDNNNHVVTTSIEHPAVLEAVRRHSHTIVGVQTTGLVDVTEVEKSITEQTILVSVGYVNNELGTMQPIKEIAAMIADLRTSRLKCGNTHPIYLHTDASQAAGLLDIQTARLKIDMMSLNGAKCYGPKQAGLLWVKPGINLRPLIVGGGQERNLRSGTESPANIVGFAKALTLAEKSRKTESERLRKLRDGLQQSIIDALPMTVINGHLRRRSPNYLHMAWPGVDGERILYALDERGVMVATGSACAANKGTRSHVLTAIGMNPDLADGSIRITLGKNTTNEDIDYARYHILEVVKKELSR